MTIEQVFRPLYNPIPGPSYRAPSPPSTGEEGRLEWGGGGSFGQTKDDQPYAGTSGVMTRTGERPTRPSNLAVGYEVSRSTRVFTMRKERMEVLSNGAVMKHETEVDIEEITSITFDVPLMPFLRMTSGELADDAEDGTIESSESARTGWGRAQITFNMKQSSIDG